jgi:hypothetical protein
MKKVLILFFVISLSGCAAVDTVKKYWPRDHDPVMFDNLVALSIEIERIDCDKADWIRAISMSKQLSRYTEWRADPQAENLKGLANHTERMSKSLNPRFCELGKKTAAQRIEAARTAWGKR